MMILRLTLLSVYSLSKLSTCYPYSHNKLREYHAAKYTGTRRQRVRGNETTKEREASNYAAPHMDRGSQSAGTPSTQTPGERAGEPRNTFLNSGNHTGTIWSPDRGSATTAIGLTKMMTSESPRITTWSLSEVKLFVEWCTTHQVF